MFLVSAQLSLRRQCQYVLTTVVDKGCHPRLVLDLYGRTYVTCKGCEQDDVQQIIVTHTATVIRCTFWVLVLLLP